MFHSEMVPAIDDLQRASKGCIGRAGLRVIAVEIVAACGGGVKRSPTGLVVSTAGTAETLGSWTSETCFPKCGMGRRIGNSYLPRLSGAADLLAWQSAPRI